MRFPSPRLHSEAWRCQDWGKGENGGEEQAVGSPPTRKSDYVMPRGFGIKMGKRENFRQKGKEIFFQFSPSSLIAEESSLSFSPPRKGPLFPTHKRRVAM